MRLLLALLCLASIGCSTMNTRVQNNPMVKTIQGNKVSVGLIDAAGVANPDDILHSRIKNIAIEWLEKKGFEIVETSAESQSAVIFQVIDGFQNVQVAARATSLPLENGGVWGSYKGAYMATVAQRQLNFSVFTAEKGSRVSSGYVYPQDASYPFYENDFYLAYAVHNLLDASVYNKLKVMKAPELASK